MEQLENLKNKIQLFEQYGGEVISSQNAKPLGNRRIY